LKLEKQYFETGMDTFLIQKAMVQKSAGLYSDAFNTLNRVKSTEKEIIYERIVLLMINLEIEKSYNELLKWKVSNVENDPSFIILETILLIHRMEWKTARNLLIQSQDLLGLTTNQIDEIISPKNKPKNPDRANSISLLAPGIGHWYAGYFWKGVVSGLFQTAAVGYSVWSFTQGYFYTGTLTGVAMFYTFYLGGSRYAEQLADKKNNLKKKEMINALLARI